VQTDGGRLHSLDGTWICAGDVNSTPRRESSGVARYTVIANSLLLCLAVAVGTEVVVTALVYLNVWLGAALPWFIAPALALSLFVFRRSGRWYVPSSLVRPPSAAMSVLASVLVATAIAAASLLCMALVSGNPLMHGRIGLYGDQYHTTGTIRTAVSLTLPVTGALCEEAGVRGALQLRLQQVVGPLSAEILAGTVFVVLHSFIIARSPLQLPFLAFAAIANGRLAAVTQRVGYSALSHTLSNGILAATYVVLRAMNR
jgi:membrane protease YdiL (CAAX protease family)